MQCTQYGRTLQDRESNRVTEEGNEGNDVMMGTHPKRALPDPNTGTSQAADDPQEDWGVVEDTSCSCYEANTVFGQTPFDADSVCNILNYYSMLWNAVHLWNKASHFAYNQYRQWNLT